jgi:hypothetical protein
LMPDDEATRRRFTTLRDAHRGQSTISGGSAAKLRTFLFALPNPPGRAAARQSFDLRAIEEFRKLAAEFTQKADELERTSSNRDRDARFRRTQR